MWFINLCCGLILDTLFRLIHQNIFNLLTWRYSCTFLFCTFYKYTCIHNKSNFTIYNVLNTLIRSILTILGILLCSRSLNFFDMYSLYFLIPLLSNIKFDETLIISCFLIIRVFILNQFDLLVFPLLGIFLFVFSNYLTYDCNLSLIDDMQLISFFSIIFTIPFNSTWIFSFSFILFGILSVFFFYSMTYTIKYSREKLIIISLTEIIVSLLINRFI